MALINSSSFGNLNSVSADSNSARPPTTFFNVFITGKPRGKMKGYLYQCPASFEENNSEYFILNQEEVEFIPLYIKKYWAKYERRKYNDGNEGDACIAFGWNETDKKIEGAKTEYIIAGYLWDNNTNNVAKHQKDIEESGIKAGEPILIYFRCKGFKCDSAFTYLRRVNEQAKNLKPLSDNPTFEQTIINPRRFLIKATIEQKDSQWGPQSVFSFTPVKALPDSLVQKILDAANNKYLDKFNEQFDKSSVVGKKSSGGDSETTESNENTAASDSSDGVDVPDVSGISDDSNPGDNFDIDI